ncbi:L,D-transpeptidase [Candidatus Gracilibacteria bacterium]|nr:L,D-transpeptidase [Candidatus Gracilibacteria bacterium]NUJ99458.1 L,D-transpeptidase [Candidatus Gracilibacteria bacterium]
MGLDENGDSGKQKQETNNYDSLYILKKNILLGAPEMRKYIVLFGQKKISNFIDEYLYEKEKEIIFSVFEEEFKKIGISKQNKGLDLQESIKYVGSKKEILESSDIQDSIKSSGKEEVSFFIDFFGIGNYFQFEQKVKEIQVKYGCEKDGTLGGETLKQIYLNYYKGEEKNKLPDFILYRLNIYEEMSLYKSKNKKALAGKLNIFKYETYYGKGEGENTNNTFINENLEGKVRKNLGNGKNTIIFSQIDGKSVLTFYEKGNLLIATYVSPGTTNGHSTPKGVFKGERNLDMYHISSTYPKGKGKTKEEIIKNSGGAIMPYAIHVVGDVRIHGSDGQINGEPQSHGCIRAPLFYIRELHMKVEKIGKDNISIDTRNIY